MIQVQHQSRLCKTHLWQNAPPPLSEESQGQEDHGHAVTPLALRVSHLTVIRLSARSVSPP